MGRGIRILAALALLAMGEVFFYAAKQGDTGPTSTASFSINLVIPEIVRISGLSDVSFGYYSGSGALANNQDVCVYVNTGAGLYSVTAIGDGAGNGFTIVNASSETIPYNLFWNSASETAAPARLTSGTALTHQTTVENVDPFCKKGNTADITVQITEPSLFSASEGNYSGTVTFVVSPQ